MHSISGLDNMDKSYYFFIVFILFCGIVCPSVNATEIILEDGVLIAQNVDDEYGVGAFDVVLEYESNVSIQMVEWVEPYVGAFNPDQNGVIRIAGFTASSSPPVGDISLVRLNVTGSGSVLVYVDDLINIRGDQIETVNAAYGEEITDVPFDIPSEPVSQNPVNMDGTEMGVISPTELETPVETDIPVGTQSPVVSEDDMHVSEELSENHPVETVVSNVEGNYVEQLEPTKSPLNPICTLIFITMALLVVQRVYKG